MSNLFWETDSKNFKFKTESCKNKVVGKFPKNSRERKELEKIETENRSKIKNKISMLDVKNRKQLNRVKVENTDMIDDCTFAECNKLEEVVIGEGVKVIGRGAFAFCDNLKTVVLPKSLEYIQNDAFRECKNLQKIIIGGKLQEIGDNAFRECENLKLFGSIDQKNELKTIGESAFYNCKNLESIYLGKYNSLKEIKNDAFLNCNKIHTISLPNNVEKIGDYAFQGCLSEDYEVIVPEIKSDNQVEYNTQKLPPTYGIVSIPKSVKEIGKYAFSMCKNLMYIHMDSECKVSDLNEGVFFKNENLEEIDLSNNIQNIGKGAFSDCKRLTNIELPESVKNIDEFAFQKCDNLKLVLTNGKITQRANSFTNNVKIADKKDLELNFDIEDIDGKQYEVISGAKKTVLKPAITFNSIKNAISKSTNKKIENKEER